MTLTDSSATAESNVGPLSAITSDSPSYGFIEYFLRLNLQSSTARIIEAWEVSNPQLTVQFERRAKDVLTMEAWLDTAQLPANNQEEECIKRGFQFNSSSSAGVRFNVGKIQLDRDSTQHDGSGVIRKRMLLCKVAVGRAYNATEDFAKIAAIPDGYDSFVIDKDKLQSLEDATAVVMTNDLGDLEYIIKDSSQILPTFIIVFEYDPREEQKSRQASLCENCEATPASVFCQADSANLCAACDVALHSSKLTCRHQRTPLEAGPQTFSTCRHHPDKLVEFFCPTCSRPVCVHCKMVGHHATGEAARHKLITVAEAFKGVSDSASAKDPILESRRQRIKAQMAAVADRVRAIEANSSDIQQQLEEIYKRALSDLKNITKKKVNVLKGDLVELHRQVSEINQLESFLAYQQGGGNATQFILDWTHHQRLRAELHAFPHFPDTIDVQPDIKINGGIQVHVDAAGLPPPSTGEEGGGMRQSGLLDGRPRYTQSTARSRLSPTVDFSSLTKMRKGTEFTESALNTLGKC